MRGERVSGEGKFAMSHRYICLDQELRITGRSISPLISRGGEMGASQGSPDSGQQAKQRSDYHASALPGPFSLQDRQIGPYWAQERDLRRFYGREASPNLSVFAIWMEIFCPKSGFYIIEPWDGKCHNTLNIEAKCENRVDIEYNLGRKLGIIEINIPF